MAKIEYAKYQDGANLFEILLSFCGLICMVAAVLGIKFKWFKHRLNFESSINELNPTTSSTRNNTTNHEIFRSTSATQYKATPFEVGVFRKKSDDELDLVRPKDLPPIRIKSASVKLPKQFNNPKLHSLHTTSSSKSHIQKVKTDTTNLVVNNNKSPSRSDKSNQNRSNSKSPKKDRQHKTHSDKRNQEKHLADKKLLGAAKSEPQTKLIEKENQQNLIQDISNNNLMENKKNIKKKIQFENVPDEKDDRNSKQLQRRPTGFTKLSKEELEELESINEQVCESPKQRRATGFELLSKEEFEELEDLVNCNDDTAENRFNSIQFPNFEEIYEPIAVKNTSRAPKEGNENNLITDDEIIKSTTKNNLNNYPGVIEQENGQLAFKISGFSDNEDNDDADLYSNLKIKTQKSHSLPSYYSENIIKDENNITDSPRSSNNRPEPQPRTTLKQSKEINTEEISDITCNLSLSSSTIMTKTSSHIDNNTTDQEEDSWSAVRNYRNLTEEMAKHNQAIREAAKEKAARRELRNPLAYDEQNSASTKPRNMKDVKRRHYENEEKEKKANQAVNLKNTDDGGDSEISC